MVERRLKGNVLRKKKIGEQIVQAIEETYMETKSTVKVNCVKVEEFLTTRSLRQVCPLSPILFSLNISDIEDREEGWSLEG